MARRGECGSRVVFGLTSPLSVNGLLAPVLPELVDRGWEVHVVCGEGDVQTDLLPEGVAVHRVPMDRSISPMADLVALRRWVRLLGRLRPDVVVGGTPKAAMLSMLAARYRRIPVRVFHLRGARWDGMAGRRADVLRLADRATAMAATHVLAVSDSLADLVLARGITDERPVVLGRGGSKGVDTEVFRPRNDSEYSADPPTLGFMGRLSVDKGIGDVLAVYAMCRREFPDLRLTVVGDIDEAQPVPAEVLAALSGPGFRWIPHTRDPATVMRAFDLLVFPSIREGLPNVVIEAAACGVPTVGYDTTGVRDAVADGRTGVLVPLGNREALAKAVANLLWDSPGRARLAAQARAEALQNFSRDSIASNFADWLSRVGPVTENRSGGDVANVGWAS